MAEGNRRSPVLRDWVIETELYRRGQGREWEPAGVVVDFALLHVLHAVFALKLGVIRGGWHEKKAIDDNERDAR